MAVPDGGRESLLAGFSASVRYLGTATWKRSLLSGPGALFVKVQVMVVTLLIASSLAKAMSTVKAGSSTTVCREREREERGERREERGERREESVWDGIREGKRLPQERQTTTQTERTHKKA